MPNVEETKCEKEYAESGLCPPLIFSASILPLSRKLLLEEVDHRLNSFHSPEVQSWNAFDILISNTVEGFVLEGIKLHTDISENKSEVALKVLKCCLLRMLR